MQLIKELMMLVDGYKTYASTIAAILSALGMIAAKDYSHGLSSLFQALAVLFSGGAMASMRHALAKTEDPVRIAPISAKIRQLLGDKEGFADPAEEAAHVQEVRKHLGEHPLPSPAHLAAAIVGHMERIYDDIDAEEDEPVVGADAVQKSATQMAGAPSGSRVYCKVEPEKPRGDSATFLPDAKH